jgi:hypothetical protein
LKIGIFGVCQFSLFLLLTNGPFSRTKYGQCGASHRLQTELQQVVIQVGIGGVSPDIHGPEYG